MKRFIHDLLFLFPGRDRWKLALLLCIIIITALFEVAGAASIMPFMSLLVSPDVVMRLPLLQRLCNMLGMHTLPEVQMMTGTLTLTLLLCSNLASLLSGRLLLVCAHSRSHVVSHRLLQHYLGQDYPFFLIHNSTELTRNILSEVPRMSGSVIVPALQLLARSVVALSMVGLLLSLYPQITLVVAGTISSIYALLYLVIRRRLTVDARAVVEADSVRHRMVEEAFGGIKPLLLSGQQGFFTSRFHAASVRHAHYTARTESWSLLPKYVLEMMAFGGMVMIALHLLHTQGGDASRILPVLAIYAFAGYRLMPAMQQIYGNAVLIRYHGVALTAIVAALRTLPQEQPSAAVAPMVFDVPLVIDRLSYAYPNGSCVLQDISLTIAPRTVVGFAGMSGAGKTTLVDVILGLLEPTTGSLRVGEAVLGGDRRRSWQALLGYVPQHIFLTDDTIAANIAFGIAPEAWDMAAVERAAKRAHLHEFILSLPSGYQTVVGENGVRLSGGQRQRIGIARALYREPSILILDEATSALDNITENAVMEAIAEMSGQLTVLVIAHRFSTLKACHSIHLLMAGRLCASGSYQELLEKSPEFRRLATSGNPQ